MLVDFSQFQHGLRGYDGSEKKTSIIMNNKHYMVKFQKRLSENKEKPLASSYANNVFSEYIGCHIIQTMDYPVQKTILGKYQDRICVACEDFIQPGYVLREFSQLENSFLDSDEVTRTPKLNDVIDILNRHEFLEPIRQKAINRFWDTFIIDGLTGNFDRHSGNWGYLVNESLSEIKLAPIYDCGSCLYPGISDDGISKIIRNNDEIENRIYVFPNAALSLDNKKINYFDFISSCKNKECNKALVRLFDRIDMSKIKDTIYETPMMSDIRKEFLSIMVENRYEKILKYSYKEISKTMILIDKGSTTIKNFDCNYER